MKFRKDIKFTTLFLLSLGFTISVLLLFPQVQQIIIKAAEFFLHRALRSREKWMNILLRCSVLGIVLFGFLITVFIMNPWSVIKQKISLQFYYIKISLMEINIKSLYKPFALLCSIYFIGILALLRANFLYIDDLGRGVREYRGFGFGRGTADFMYGLLQTGIFSDISPLSQILAVLIMTAGSLLLVYVLCDGEIRTAPLIASASLGLSPYFLENISFKFDSPYMAFSVLFSIVPFLFVKRLKIFWFISFIFLVLTAGTYQAFSGVYPVVTLFIAFHRWNYKKNGGGGIL